MLFYYQAEYILGNQGPVIQKGFEKFASRFNLTLTKTDLICDGGNFVDNNQDQAVITSKILTDNKDWTETQIKEEIKKKTGVKYVAIIPREEGDVLAHSDGMVTFSKKRVLVVNIFKEPFRTQVLNSLKS